MTPSTVSEVQTSFRAVAQIADQAASEGVIDLRQAGLNKVKDGVTSLEEVNRVTIE